MPIEPKRPKCMTCNSCIKKNSGDFDRFGHWIPPHERKYMCMRTYFTLSKGTPPQNAPCWCPRLEECDDND